MKAVLDELHVDDAAVLVAELAADAAVAAGEAAEAVTAETVAALPIAESKQELSSLYLTERVHLDVAVLHIVWVPPSNLRPPA